MSETAILPATDELLTPQEFAALAKASVPSVRKLLTKPGFPYLEVGSRKKIFKNRALNYLAQQTERSLAPEGKKIYNKQDMIKATKFQGTNYAGSFDAKSNRWKANIKKPDGKWTTKWCPKELTIHQSVEAEAFIVAEVQKVYSTWTAPTNNNVIIAKTLAVLVPRWLKLREESLSTKVNYYKSLSVSGRCWILDNPGFDHFSIQNLDIETELTMPVIRTWINSLKGAPLTRVASISALSTFFDDAVDEGWLSEDFTNPMQKRPIKKIVQSLKQLAKETSEVKVVPFPHVNQLLTNPAANIEAVRRVKYLLAITSGMRDHEIQGLTFSDIHLDAEIPYVQVDRQLLKRGCLPARIYEQEVARGVSKEDLFSSPNAVVSLPKRGSKRPIPLHPVTVAALRWWKANGWRSYVGRKPEASDPVFARSKRSLRDGHQAGDFCDMMAAEVLNLDLSRCQLEGGVTFHGLRRSFASELAKLGTDGAIIDRLMGHAKKSVAEKSYIKVFLEPLYAAVCKLPVEAPTFSMVQQPKLALVVNESTTKQA